MHFTIKNENLLNILKTVSGGLYKTHTQKKDILTHILLRIYNNKIFCISTNDDIEIITYEHLVNDNKNGEIIISHKLIYDICRTCLKNSTIYFSKSNKQIKIIYENSELILSRNIYTTFPLLTKNNTTNFYIHTFSDHVKTLLNKTFFSIAENDSRLFLNGLFLENDNTKLYATSSDGFRLSFDYITIKKTNCKIKLLLPKQTILDILGIFPDNELMQIYATHNYINFSTGKIILTSKIINNNNPNYQELLKYQEKISITANKEEFKNALKKTHILHSEKNKIAKLTVTNNHMKITIATRSKYITSTIKINNNTNYNTEINLNLKYLKDILSTLKATTVYIIFLHSDEALIIKEPKPHNGIYKIMLFKL